MDTSMKDPVVACYVDQNFVSMLHLLAKYQGFSELVLANANAGGENVHRGLVLGALIGAQVGASGIPQELKAGLHHIDAIEADPCAARCCDDSDATRTPRATTVSAGPWSSPTCG